MTNFRWPNVRLLDIASFQAYKHRVEDKNIRTSWLLQEDGVKISPYEVVCRQETNGKLCGHQCRDSNKLGLHIKRHHQLNIKHAHERDEKDAVKNYFDSLEKKETALENILTQPPIEIPLYNNADRVFVEKLKGLVYTQQGGIKVKNDAELKIHLEADFTGRVLYGHDWLSTHSWSIERQLETWQPLREKFTAYVWLPKQRRSQRLDYAQVLSIFGKSSPDPVYPGANLLDLVDITDLGFLPPSVREVSLRYKIDNIKRSGHMDRVNVHSNHEKRYLLMTKAPSVTSFHSDSMGFCSMVMCIQGSKLWYIPNGKQDDAHTDVRLNGTQFTEYRYGVSTYVLRPGSFLVLEPAAVHAVYTAEDTLMAGVEFYTSATFARSLKCIWHSIRGFIHTNDERSHSNYQEVIEILGYLNNPAVFTVEQKKDIIAVIFRMLEDMKVISKTDSSSAEWISEEKTSWTTGNNNDDGFLEEAHTAWLMNRLGVDREVLQRQMRTKRPADATKKQIRKSVKKNMAKTTKKSIVKTTSKQNTDTLTSGVDTGARKRQRTIREA